MEPPAPTDATPVIRGLSDTLKTLRRNRPLGPLEIVILIAVVLMLLAGFVSIYFVIDQQLAARDRERLASSDRERMEQILSNTASALTELRAAIAGGPAAQNEAIDRLLAGIQALLERQTEIIIREDAKRERETVVVVVSPQPAPRNSPTPCGRAVVVVGDCRAR